MNTMRSGEEGKLAQTMPEGRHLGPASGPVSFREAFCFWVTLGFISFGGPTGQIAVMHAELVEKKRWIGESRFLHALNYCMLLPGPEAQQLAIYIGWLLHGTKGGIVAGAFFVIPSVFILWMLSYVYVTYGNVQWISWIFYGLKGAVMAIVAAAVVRIGRKALKNEVLWLLAVAAFVAIFFFKLPFPLIIAAAAIIGFAGEKLLPGKFIVASSGSMDEDEDEEPIHTRPSLRRALKILTVCLALWCIPVLSVGIWKGWDHTLFREGIFFSKAAMVTFGGAYAVLPYVAQQAVETFHWLQPGQMMDGLALAETTPGPLIMVVQFVGFMGGWNQPGDMDRLAAATMGALITTWVTFVPCFLWIFLGAPHIEQLRSNTRLTAAFSAVTAAVVGVVLNLAVWFAIHSLLPDARRIDWFLLTITIAALVAMLRWKWNIVLVILASGFLGLLYNYLIR